MKIPKIGQPAKIYCSNGILVKGIIHLSEGERVLDYANDKKEDFIPVTKVELYYTQWPFLKKVASNLMAKKDVIIMNKSSIMWIEEDTQEE